MNITVKLLFLHAINFCNLYFYLNVEIRHSPKILAVYFGQDAKNYRKNKYVHSRMRMRKDEPQESIYTS